MDFSTVFFNLMINVIVFSFIAWSVKNKYDLKKEELRALGGSQSLGTSELKGMIQESMMDALAPLEEPFELIESHMRRLPEGSAEATSALSEERKSDDET
ncbi:MAG: hypothetical protein BMS9Abin05_1591 [Rhodothermia bacterium]|nr:MAG: hypothetical protein BMS9Abin05_1591 [Rhodothermia bacterium]